MFSFAFTIFIAFQKKQLALLPKRQNKKKKAMQKGFVGQNVRLLSNKETLWSTLIC